MLEAILMLQLAPKMEYTANLCNENELHKGQEIFDNNDKALLGISNNHVLWSIN